MRNLILREFRKDDLTPVVSNQVEFTTPVITKPWDGRSNVLMFDGVQPESCPSPDEATEISKRRRRARNSLRDRRHDR